MRDRHLKYLLVLPAVTVVFATAVWPLIQSLILSFRNWKLSRSSEPGPFVGWENYGWAIFEDPNFWNATAVTTVYTVLTVALTTLIALGIALLLAPGGRLRLTVRTLLILPFAMSPALVGVSFRFMFNPEFGLFDAFFGLLVPPLAEVSWLSDPTLAFAVCVMADIWGWIPFITLVLIGGIAALPRETVEAAYVDVGLESGHGDPQNRNHHHCRRNDDQKDPDAFEDSLFLPVARHRRSRLAENVEPSASSNPPSAA